MSEEAIMENVFEMAWLLKGRWDDLTFDVRMALIDKVQGSRGLSELVQGWAKEFEESWQLLPEDDTRRDDWFGEIGAFVDRNFNALISELVKERISP